MSAEAPSESEAEQSEGRTASGAPRSSTPLPTAPCSVVWSKGHPFVLEGTHGRARWVGVDDRGRPQRLTGADLQRRGWTSTRSR
ncbi:hypothetical protein [Gandjariella thermophila]|nr:hypothetical protein [Gandjariella thermophila]